MCNAWNHWPDCDCGFGGDTGGGWGTAALVPPASPAHASWTHRDDDFCRPTSCPECRADVYFVRPDGGSVWFDELGWPWPKHACFDDDATGRGLRSALALGPAGASPVWFGVVIETVATRPGQGGRLVVRCSDRKVMDCEFDTTREVSQLLGRLVTVHPDEGGGIRVVPVEKVEPPVTPSSTRESDGGRCRSRNGGTGLGGGRSTPADRPSPEAQAYELLLACRLQYETPGETEEFMMKLATLLPGGKAPAMAPPAAPPDEATSGDDEIERLYGHALAVWSHPDVPSDLQMQAYGFLMRYLARGRASARFVASVSDEATLMMARPATSSEGTPEAKGTA